MTVHKAKVTVILSLLCVTLFLMVACGGQSTKEHTAVSDALRALKKIEAAIQVDSSFAQYQQLVLEAKVSINEASVVLPDGELKDKLNSSIEAYRDAGTAWEVGSKGLLQDYTEPGKTLSAKYGIEMQTAREGYLEMTRAFNQRGRDESYPNAAAKRIFSIAKTRVDRASALGGQ